MAMLRSRGRRSFTTSPSMAIVPFVTSSRPAMVRSRVDLPQPDGPTKTQNSPSGTVRSMPLRASIAP